MMNEAAEFFELQDGEIIYKPSNTVIYKGANRLLEIFEHKGRLYVIGEELTFLQIRPTLVVEVMDVATVFAHKYIKYTCKPIESLDKNTKLD